MNTCTYAHTDTRVHTQAQAQCIARCAPLGKPLLLSTFMLTCADMGTFRRICSCVVYTKNPAPIITASGETYVLYRTDSNAGIGGYVNFKAKPTGICSTQKASIPNHSRVPGNPIPDPSRFGSQCTTTVPYMLTYMLT